MLNLRDYQQAALDAHFEFFRFKPEGSPLFVMPTGSGKSVVIAAFLERLLTNWPNLRVLCLTHVKELIAQNYAKLRALWPEAPAGVYSAGLKSRDMSKAITFAGIQSVYDKAERLGHVDLVIVDECHLIPHSGSGMYRKLLSDLGAINLNFRLVGYTATPYRLDGGYLHEGEGALFSDIALDIPIRNLIANGWLAPLVSKRVMHAIDTKDVGTRAGDFIQKELEAIVSDEDTVRESVEEAIELSQKNNRKQWLIFASSVAHAHMIHAMLVERDIVTRVVTGETPGDVRDEIIKETKAGKIAALVNVSVLTTGFDWPACDCLWLMRPTQSTALYVQMMGRGMRTAPGKANCLVLDYGENVLRHGPVDMVQPKKPGEGAGEAPSKVCPGCDSIVHAAVLVCPDCGHRFPPRGINVSGRSSDAAPISEPAREEWLEVESMNLAPWKKPGKTDSVRVNYSAGGGIRQVAEWVCPQHGGFATEKFRRWWFEHGGHAPEPDTVEEAIDRQGELVMPRRISLVKDETGKWDRIRRREMPSPEEMKAAKEQVLNDPADDECPF